MCARTRAVRIRAVDGTPLKRHYECTYARLAQCGNVLLELVVRVGADVASLVAGELLGVLVHQIVPDARRFAVRIPGALDLERSGGGAEQEVVGETLRRRRRRRRLLVGDRAATGAEKERMGRIRRWLRSPPRMRLKKIHVQLQQQRREHGDDDDDVDASECHSG